MPATGFEPVTSILGGWRSIHAELRGHFYLQGLLQTLCHGFILIYQL